MDLRRWISVGIAVAALGAAAVPASAHNGPAACVLLASPAQVNNVEMGPPVPSTNPMNPAAVGHSGQKRGEGQRFGLYYPVTDPITDHWTTTGPNPGPHGTGVIPATKGDHFYWHQSGVCANQAPGAPQVSYNAGGTGIGYCGRSVGLGLGTLTGGHTTTIKWESGGSQLILTDPSATGSVNAQANPPGSANGSCLDGGASVFIVDGVLVHQ
jgi:hypothetical protein